MAGEGSRRRFGQLTKMRSARWQARYSVPLGHPSGRGSWLVTAPYTFEATRYGKQAAEDWLRDEERRLAAEGAAWLPLAEKVEAERRAAQAAAKPTFSAYAEKWLETRKVRGRPLQPSTVRGYKIWIRKYLEPAFGDLPLDQITPALVIAWHEGMDQEKRKTLKESYSLGSAIMRSATSSDGVLAGYVNPFAIDGAGTIGARSDKREELVEDYEIPIILQTIRDEWQALVWLALGCGLRFGEATALRRARDFDLRSTPPVVKVRHAIGTEAGGRQYEKPPKSDAGNRDQRIPEAVWVPLRKHFSEHVAGRDGLLFPAPEGGWLTSSRFQEASGGWHDVRTALKRPGLNFHDLRATGATRMARAGANVAEVQAFLGDSTPSAAMRYVRAAQSRMDELTTTAFASLSDPFASPESASEVSTPRR